jgi:acyl-CoA thioesterase-1
MSIEIKSHSLILFQGDSITDAGRNRDDGNHLGSGYVMLIAAWHSALYPEKKIHFLNRGIGGDRSKDLIARWDEDCLDIKPDVLSIMVGVNDTWRKFDSNDPTSAEQFEENLHILLKKTQASLGCKIIIMEPYILPYPEDRIKMREDLDPKIHACRKIARTYGTEYIPLDGIFAQATTRRDPVYWAGDGIHPTAAGHALIAQEWLKVVCG